MRRAALERPRTLRVWRQHLAGHSDTDLCRCEFQPGRFRKGERVGGCGNPGANNSPQYVASENRGADQVRDRPP